jgi:hypothetical protein
MLEVQHRSANISYHKLLVGGHDVSVGTSTSRGQALISKQCTS